ncbi:acylneuraminate cytidylyltransferase family protein [Ohtaekwangia koreensis]|jgi:CMP-N,N'-diacetyllegionaminic acid synthase|uniref:N-acylneuraminate cytidylyltransferase n=1 Tax=Ohtaekwangia koreensis TaxID=688867 RepID=A0A1T5M428_9BACT|nr:acylneuraminate cytidylyltransferase family protein [Ohtaekwangia koreensis]SKC83007.1 N-acylneuraminate cytidylyltransferase [Ohtaekwangia koreensis]
MKTLVIIPARGGSKGIPLKNIKPLGGIPLIHHSIKVARTFTDDADICISTDSDKIIDCVLETGLKVPFTRPESLATDTAGTYEVLLHALDFYAKNGIQYDSVLLMQPTSPFRKAEHLQEIKALYTSSLDMVVSVGVSPYSPYFNIFEEDQEGFLQKSKSGSFKRRQDAPSSYFYNGSLYMINVFSLRKQPLHEFKKVRKYVMDELHSQDIDSPLDWALCETILNQGLV